MSTFEGKLLEETLDFIRVDQFETKNHDGRAFFLSHFHSDHFKGIFDECFAKLLRENEDKFLYCTSLTKNFLVRHQKCQIPEHKIIPLTLNAQRILEHRQMVQVVSLPAGHCPGSAMFLFEQETKHETVRVLYTGDFRINPDELHKFKALHHRDGTLKKINTLYLDTTFCHPKYLSFPSRKQTEEDLIMIARDWLNRSADHRVGIRYNSYHGMEHLLIKIAKSLKTQINVRDDNSFINYSCVAELEPMLCQSEVNTTVHLCSVKEGKVCSLCYSYRGKVKTIKPCAMSFNSEQLVIGRQKEGPNGLVRIVYSMHCSLEELIGTVKYLKPDVVHPCAIPQGLTKEQVMSNLLLDVEKLKEELNKKAKAECASSPPAKKFCFSLSSEEEEEDKENEVEEEATTHEANNKCSLFSLNSGDEEENKPLSQSSIESPPL